MSDTSVSVVTGPEGLSSLRASWALLYRRLPCRDFTHLYQWHKACLDYLSPTPREAIFVALWRAGELAGVLPIHADKHRALGLAFPVLETPVYGGQDLSDFLVAKGESLSEWWPQIDAAIRAAGIHWHVIRVAHQREDGLAIRSCAALGGSLHFRPQSRSGYIDCTGSHEAVSERYSTRLAKLLRKGWRTINTKGDVHVEAVKRPDDRAAAFGEFLRLEASGWKGASMDAGALAYDDRLRAFYAELMGPQGPPEAEINLLMLSGRAVASQICLVCDGVRYVLKIGHDDALSKMSPGSLLFDAVLKRDCEDSSMKALSFVTGAAWHEEWGARFIEVGDLWMFRSRMLSAVAGCVLRVAGK